MAVSAGRNDDGESAEAGPGDDANQASPSLPLLSNRKAFDALADRLMNKGDNITVEEEGLSQSNFTQATFQCEELRSLPA